MSRYFLPLLLLGAVLLAGGGCDLGLFLQLRGQLREPRQHFTLEREGPVFTLRFLEPVVPRRSLPGLGLPAVAPAVGVASVDCLLQINGQPARRAEVTLRFAGDLLLSVSLPVEFLDLLGEANVWMSLQFAGGARPPEITITQLTPEQVRAALERAGAGGTPPGSSVQLRLVPVRAEAKSLTVRLERPPGSETYREISLIFR